MIIVEKQGNVVCAYHDLPTFHSDSKAVPLRGDITEFSRKSRRRMLLALNRCDFRKTRAVFVTLTFHSIPEIEAATKSLQKFIKRVRRKFPLTSGIWRKEFQQRGAAHFHVIFFGLPYWDWKEMLDCWRECTPDHEGSIWVKLLRNSKSIIGYVAKYIAKVAKGEGTPLLDVSPYLTAAQKPKIGRCWGYINKAALPLAETSVIAVDDDDYMRGFWIGASWVTGGRCGNNGKMCVIFTKNAAATLNLIERHAEWFAPLPPERGKICHPLRVPTPDLQDVDKVAV